MENTSQKTLSNASVKELEAELAKRARTTSVPQPISNPDFTLLTQMIIDGVNKTAQDGREDEDFDHYVYEAAMEAVYGKGFWQWLVGVTKNR